MKTLPAGLPRKEQIRIKAQTLFRERGYSATSMRDLADTLGIEAASLYNHITSKEEILQDICFAMAESFFTAVEPVMSTSLPPKEKLEVALAAHLRVIAANNDASAVFLHEWRHMGEPFLNDFKLMRRRYERLFITLIEEGIESRKFRDVDAKLVARTMLSATNWTYEAHKTDAAHTEIAELLIQGITTK